MCVIMSILTAHTGTWTPWTNNTNAKISSYVSDWRLVDSYMVFISVVSSYVIANMTMNCNVKWTL